MILETRLVVDQAKHSSQIPQSGGGRHDDMAKRRGETFDRPGEGFRPAPFLPHFGWRPGMNDFPIGLTANASARQARHYGESGETRGDYMSRVEVLSAPAPRARVWPRAVAALAVVLGVTSGALVVHNVTQDGSNSEQASITATPDDQSDSVVISTDDGEDATATRPVDRRSQPGFGGNLPGSSLTDLEAGDVVDDPTATSTEEMEVPGDGVVTVSAGEGDSLLAIADKFDVSVASLIWSNDVEDPNAFLEDGQTVRVPKDDGVVHEVQRGDDLDSIADQYGVEPDSILEYSGNGLSSDADLEEGDLILVPGGTVEDRGSLATYVVQEGDTLREIAGYYGLEPQTLVWANSLPHPELIHPDQELVIPPGDGALITVEEGDTVEAIAARFDVDPVDVYAYGFNGLSGDAVLQIDQQILVPGDFLPALSDEGPLTGESVAGEGVTGPATGDFIWPTEGYVSQEFHGGHSGLDIANEEWTPINAADGGIVIFAGWSDLGLGYAVGIDHGNGYQTWYGHMAAQPYVEVGQVIWQGGYLGPMGTTGKSTGPHLHFVVLENGVYQNPMNYLD